MPKGKKKLQLKLDTLDKEPRTVIDAALSCEPEEPDLCPGDHICPTYFY